MERKIYESFEEFIAERKIFHKTFDNYPGYIDTPGHSKYEMGAYMPPELKSFSIENFNKLVDRAMSYHSDRFTQGETDAGFYQVTSWIYPHKEPNEKSGFFYDANKKIITVPRSYLKKESDSQKGKFSDWNRLNENLLENVIVSWFSNDDLNLYGKTWFRKKEENVSVPGESVKGDLFVPIKSTKPDKFPKKAPVKMYVLNK